MKKGVGNSRFITFDCFTITQENDWKYYTFKTLKCICHDLNFWGKNEYVVVAGIPRFLRY